MLFNQVDLSVVTRFHLVFLHYTDICFYRQEQILLVNILF